MNRMSKQGKVSKVSGKMQSGVPWREQTNGESKQTEQAIEWPVKNAIVMMSRNRPIRSGSSNFFHLKSKFTIISAA